MLRTYDLFDDFFNDMFDNSYYKAPAQNTSVATNLMRTDLREKGDSYMLDIELPGYKKEDIQVELKDGNLNVIATHNETADEKNAKGNYLRRERYTGSVKRSFYVGEEIDENGIQAAFENGILTLTIAKPQPKQAPERRVISIL